jgi:hypothetical protein
MKRLYSILPQFAKATIYYVSGQAMNINQVLNLIAIREKLLTHDFVVTLQPVDTPEQANQFAKYDLLTLHLYMETMFSKNIINVRVPEETEGEFTNFIEILDVADMFTPEDTQALLRVADEADKLHKLQLHQLWELQDTKQSVVVDALIVNKLFERYLHKHHLLKYVLTHTQPTIHSLYYTVIDFLVRNHHPLGKKQAKDITHANNLQGKVLVMPQEGDYNWDHSDAFKLCPQAHYLINFWDDGRLQIVSNEEHQDVHKYLDQVYQIVMNPLKEKLVNKIIPLSVVKWVGDAMLMNIFSRVMELHDTLFFGKRMILQSIKEDLDSYLQPWDKLTAEQAGKLDKVGINLWELFHLTDHKTNDEVRFYCIPFYGRETRPGKVHQLLLTTKAHKLSEMIRKRFIQHLNKH